MNPSIVFFLRKKFNLSFFLKKKKNITSTEIECIVNTHLGAFRQGPEEEKKKKGGQAQDKTERQSLTRTQVQRVDPPFWSSFGSVPGW